MVLPTFADSPMFRLKSLALAIREGHFGLFAALTFDTGARPVEILGCTSTELDIALHEVLLPEEATTTCRARVPSWCESFIRSST